MNLIKRTLPMLALSLLISASAAALTTPQEPWDPSDPADELNLYEIYNQLYGTTFTSNAEMDPLQLDIEVFSVAPGFFGQVNAEARYAGSTEIFGWYEPVGGGAPTLHQLFNVTDLGFVTGYNATINPSGQFGFYLDPVGRLANPFLWFSEDARNGGEEHFLVYSTPDPNVYFMAWEDLSFARTDLDYQDLVLTFTTIIPEPASVLLLGIGIAGTATMRLRRRHS